MRSGLTASRCNHGVTFKAERRLRNNYAYNVGLHAVDLEGRCVESRRDGVGSQRPTEREEHLRRNRRVGTLKLRSSAPVRCERRVWAYRPFGCAKQSILVVELTMCSIVTHSMLNRGRAVVCSAPFNSSTPSN